jgi:endogenous inhibitor of DNA gyrase (YacG/DUF329 family)
MTERTRGVQLLTIPTVTVTVLDPDCLFALDMKGIAHRTNRVERKARDWRGLRSRLFDLDFKSKNAVAAWLADCGYIPRLRPYDPNQLKRWPKGALTTPEDKSQLALSNPENWAQIALLNPENANEDEWRPEFVSGPIINRFEHFRDVLKWLMSQSREEYRDLVVSAREYFDEKRDGPIDQRFNRALAAPHRFDPRILLASLIGAGSAPNVSAMLHWDVNGKASVTVHAEDPLELLGVTVRIDKEFSQRQWVICGGCGKGFERQKSSDQFCSRKCKDLAITRSRRARIKVLEQADADWRELSPEKRRELNRWEWISKRASRKNKKITAVWARIELGKIKSKGGK